MQKPIISIIIPIYNAEKFVNRCLKSILSQTFREWEVILINDGSTDHSGDICDEYSKSDSRFRVYHKSNGGVSTARNLGVEKSCGEWIMFVDADDQLTTSSLSIMADTLNTYKASQYVFSLIIEKEGRLTKGYLPYKTGDKIDAKELVRNHLLYRITNGPCAKLFHREELSKIRFPEGVKIGEDLIFCIEYALNSKLETVFVDRSTYVYYEIPTSAIHSQKSFSNEYRKLSSCMYALLKKYNVNHMFTREFAAFSIINLLTSIDKEGSKPTQSEIIELLDYYREGKCCLERHIKNYISLLSKKPLLAQIYKRAEVFYRRNGFKVKNLLKGLLSETKIN